LSIFWEYVKKMRISLKSGKNDRYHTWRPIYIFYHFRWIFLRMKNVSDKSCRENQYAHFMFSNSENHAVCEIMWKNIVLLCRPQKTMWRMRIAYWIPKDTNKHLDYVILNCLFTATMVARTCLIVMLYVHCLICCVVVCLSVSQNCTEFYIMCHKVVFF
jgi:hypothetical protein